VTDKQFAAAVTVLALILECAECRPDAVKGSCWFSQSWQWAV